MVVANKDEYECPENEAVWYSEMHHLGYNFRITDIQASLGLSQLRRLDYIIERRNAVACKYKELFADYKGIIECPLFTEDKGTVCSRHLW